MNDELDELLLQDGTVTHPTYRTLDGHLPYTTDGFRWSVQTRRPHRTFDVRGWDACGVCDGETVVRGLVDEVVVSTDHERTTLHVRPPDRSEITATNTRHEYETCNSL